MRHTELHRHLDASIRPSTLVELARELGLDTPFRTVDEVRSRFLLTRQMGSLEEVLGCFRLFQMVLRDEAILERVAREAVEDARDEGIGWLELRYSPSFTSEVSGLPWDAALRAFSHGLEHACQATGVRAGLICIVSRGYEAAQAEATIDFAVENRDEFIGVDLAGPEEGFPCRDYQAMFRRARDAGLPVTIHAGEAAGPENVWDAIELLGARRIGHGIRSIADAQLVRRLARDGILLETCPTSNYITGSVATWPDHPLPRLLDAGVPVSVSTDDPGIFGVTMDEEFSRCRRLLAMSEKDLERVSRYAREHSFLRADGSATASPMIRDNSSR